jgi:ABC-type amino acid transport substrate-binding protein
MANRSYFRFIYTLALLWAASIAAPCRADEVLKMVYFDYAPFSYQENAVARGAWIDIADELGRRTGVTVQHTVYSWARAQALVREGMADGMITLATPERLSYALPAQTVLATIEFHAFAARKNPNLVKLLAVRGINDLKDYSIVSFNGNGWVKSNLTEHKVDWKPSLAESARLVAEGQYDLTLDDDASMNVTLKENALEDQIVPVGAPLTQFQYLLFIGKHSPLFHDLPKFNAALADMSRDGTLARIRKRDNIPSSP